MRRVAIVVILILAGSLWPAVHALAFGSTAAHATPAGGLQADFNNDGADDLVVGVPGEDLGSIPDAGAVNVLYGSAAGVTGTGSQLFTQDSPRVASSAEPGDFFGEALAVGDFNHDGFADLAAGAPGESVGPIANAGVVNVLYGSASGLTGTGSQLFTQVGGTVETGDIFGNALAAGDFNHDGFADLAASAPFEAIGSVEFAGAVSVLYGSAAGLTRTGGQLFTQVGGTVEAFDVFGFSLAAGDFNNNGFADLAAGAPGEDIGNIPDAGAVSVLYGSAGGLSRTGGQLFTQVGGTVEAGDNFGHALAAGDFNNNSFADLAASAPFEAIGSIPEAGAVSVLYGSAGGLSRTGGQLFTQVGGTVEFGDWFGWALTAGDFNHDGHADLAASALFEAIGSIRDAGAVSVVYGSAAGLTRTGGQLFSQNSSGVPDTAEEGDLFGDALAASDPAPSTASASPSGPGASPSGPGSSTRRTSS
jgi:hypothetical protein